MESYLKSANIVSSNMDCQFAEISFNKRSALLIQRLKQMTETWSEKSDKETLQKQIDLDNLKTARAKDLEKYQNLARTVRLVFLTLHLLIKPMLASRICFKVYRVRKSGHRGPL